MREEVNISGMGKYGKSVGAASGHSFTFFFSHFQSEERPAGEDYLQDRNVDAPGGLRGTRIPRQVSQATRANMIGGAIGASDRTDSRARTRSGVDCWTCRRRPVVDVDLDLRRRTETLQGRTKTLT